MAVSLIKRVLQCAMMMPASMACGLLFMVSTVMKERESLQMSPTLNNLLKENAFEKMAVGEMMEEEKEEDKKKKGDKKKKEDKEEKMEEEDKDDEDEEDDDEDEVKDLDDSFFDEKDGMKEEEDSADDHTSAIQDDEEEEEEQAEKEEKEQLPTTKYNITARDPKYSGAVDTLYFELTLLRNHYHPTVAKFAQTILRGEYVVCKGDPLTDFSNKAFLDKFAYKHAKKRDLENARDRGSQAMQPKKKSQQKLQEPVNSEAFLNQKEEDVAVEDQFFYKFFKEKARREGPSKKNKKNKKGEEGMQEVDEDEEAAMDLFAENLAEEMMAKRVGSEDEDIEDDFGDLEEQFEEAENGRFMEDGEELNEDDEDDEDGMGMMFDEDGEGDEDGEDDELGGGMVLDEGDEDGHKKKKKQTETHKKKMKSLYASAEEFEAMLQQTAQARQEQEEKFKKGSKKRGRDRGGKGGKGGKFQGKRRK